LLCTLVSICPATHFFPHEAEKDAAGAFTTEDLGVGQVLSSKPFRDEDKQKFWIYTVQFKNPDGTVIHKEIVESAESTGVELFPQRSDLPTNYPVKPFSENFDEKRAEIKASICSLVQHEGLTDLEAIEWDESFFTSIANF
jgi:hypothetical protein